jgi:hypothetical protein
LFEVADAKLFVLLLLLFLGDDTTVPRLLPSISE